MTLSALSGKIGQLFLADCRFKARRIIHLVAKQKAATPAGVATSYETIESVVFSVVGPAGSSAS